MSSIILELQRDAINSNNTVSDLLRKAKLISVKLELDEFKDWVENELNGYEVKTMKDLPNYRILSGITKAWNPYHGWQPVLFTNNEVAEIMSKKAVTQPIGELEMLVKQNSDVYEMNFSSSTVQDLIKATGFETDYKFIIGINSVVGVIEGVRNLLLDWVLKLEKAGIKGENLTFTNEEMNKASHSNINYNFSNIGNFNGVVGDISNGSKVEIEQKNFYTKEKIHSLLSKIETDLDNSDLDKKLILEAKKVNEEIKKEIEEIKPNEGKISKLLNSLKNIFEGAVGNVVAQGIIVEIAKHLIK